MFKYISEILKEFNPAKKLLVLIILLISIISVTYITMITKTPEELSKTISVQRKGIIKNQQYISELSLKVNSLSDSIVKMNQRCNDRAIEREKVYVEEMLEQQKYINNMIDEVQFMVRSKIKISNKPLKMELDTQDSVFTAHSKVILVEDDDNIDNKILNKLENIKNKLKK